MAKDRSRAGQTAEKAFKSLESQVQNLGESLELKLDEAAVS